MEETAPIDVPGNNTQPVDAGGKVEPAGGLTEVTGREGLWSGSFVALIVTQFLVALNDNMFRWLLLPIGKDLIDNIGLSPEFALSAGSALFLLPFLLLAAPAGYLADRFSKRNVMVGCKVAEIVIMGLGIAVILSANIYLMGVVLFLMGAQSTLFSPSKFGSIPEIVREDRISAANGIVAMTTILAIIVGGLAGGFLYAATTLPDGHGMPGQFRWWISASALIGVAIAGWVASLFIGRLRSANPERRFPLNPAAQTLRDLASLAAKRPLFLAALGTAFFWSMAALTQMNVDKFAEFELFVEQQYVGPLLGALAVGIGLGSVLAGICSGGKIQLGIVPIGAAGIAASAMLLSTVSGGAPGEPSSQAYSLSCFWLVALGTSAGLYDIPLMAFLQARSPAKSRGSILAASNFISFSGMILASGVFWVLAGALGLSARQVFLVAGLATVPACVLIVRLIPTETTRLLTSLLVRVLYRVRLRDSENLPREGGALLVCNHVSWIDGVLLILYLPRPARMIAYVQFISGWGIRRLARDSGVIPVGPERKSVVRTIRAAREALRQGDIVCIFPEGGITRDGQIGSFQPGFLSLVKKTGAPVIPVYLGGLWGSVFSFERGRFFWKWPRGWRRRVSIRFGPPISEDADPEQVRLAVQQLEG